MIRIVHRYICNNKYLLRRYIVVGLSAGIIDFGVLFILTGLFGLYYLLSATISFTLAAIFNYYFNRKWTFKSNGRRRKQVPIFFTIAILGLLINNNIIYIAVEKLGVHYLLGKLIAAAIVTIWNFSWNKHLTFRIE